MESSNNYKNIWDKYVTDDFPRIKDDTPFALKSLADWRVLNRKDLHYEWPGDEWGDMNTVKNLFEEAVVNNYKGQVNNICEIGSGSGRYTNIAFDFYPNSNIQSYDVSSEFESQLRKRFSNFILSEQLKTFEITADPFGIFKNNKKLDLIGEIDIIYSFDAMVHVDLHTLFIYWLNSTLLLRKNGLLAMNVGDACSYRGFEKLVHDANTVFRRQGNAGSHFMWISKEIVVSILTRLGFETTFHPGNGRDLAFSAILKYPEKGKAIVNMIGPKNL